MSFLLVLIGLFAKDRFALSRDGEPGQNCLFAGLELFFTHTGLTVKGMVQWLRQGRPPADAMKWLAAEDAKRGAYQPCACGSGNNCRFCFGDKAPSTLFSGIDRETKTS